MLDLKKVLGAKPKEHVEAQLAELFTSWGEQLDPDHVLEEHPTPQFAREHYAVLNGQWKCTFVQSGHSPAGDLETVVRTAEAPADDAYDCQILVPFSPEAPLSGVRRQLQPDELLWYRRAFCSPSVCMRGQNGSTQKTILHFEAVDYACAVRINGVLADSHVGGYTPFAIDITELLVEGENVLEVCVADPSEFGGKLRGKQRFDRGDIWYTAQSGIWQAVWLESVPALHLVETRIEADLDTGIVAIGARIAGFETNCPANNTPVLSAEVLSASGEPIAQSGTLVDGATCALAVHVPNVHPWSPDDPYLYQVNLRLNDDFVHSYCGFRSVEIGHDASGAPCISFNHQPLFVKGVLDQAYWSDGLMTAPSDDALIFDIQAMHDAGFNLMRKHIKVECARWYYHCDRLGMLVLQDMVSGGDQDIHTWHWSYKPTLFKPSWNHYRDTLPSHQANLGAGNAAYRKEWMDTSRQVVNTLFNHPCIIGWSLFNEGWGQFDARKAIDMVRNLDSTRVIDAVSGWYDQRCGDFKSVHNYFRELEVWPDRKDRRAFFISEFGGFSHRVDGHSALDESYGYEVYDDIAEWRRNVQELLKHMDAMEGKGLAGYIYTQVSDIEEETNGLLTYDRRVNKLL